MKLDPAESSYGAVFQTLSSCIAPRPIALVSTVSPQGMVNVAPFSMFTLLSASPALLGISILPRHGNLKDTMRNIAETGEFVVNTVTPGLVEEMVRASADYPPEVSEAAVAGLRTLPSDLVRPPRLEASPVHLECRRVDILHFARSEASFVVGEIVRIHMDDALLRDGFLDVFRYSPLGHLASGPKGHAFATIGRVIRSDPPEAVGK